MPLIKSEGVRDVYNPKILVFKHVFCALKERYLFSFFNRRFDYTLLAFYNEQRDKHAQEAENRNENLICFKV